jgi:gluconolactonase
MNAARRLLITCCALLVHWTTAQGADAVPIVTGLGFPEGVIFVGDSLYFVDYQSSDVLRIVDGKATRIWHGDGCGANGLVQGLEGLLVACYDSNSIAIVSFEGKDLGRIDKDDAGAAFELPNDFALDRKEGLYFTASGNAPRSGKVYYRARAGQFRTVASGIDFANGVAVSPDDHTLFVGESKTDNIYRYAIAADGTLDRRSLFAHLSTVLKAPQAVKPDGIRVDHDGNLFVALYEGAGLVVLDRDANVLRRVALPGVHHTSLAISPDARFIYATGIDSPGTQPGGAIYRVANPQSVEK